MILDTLETGQIVRRYHGIATDVLSGRREIGMEKVAGQSSGHGAEPFVSIGIDPIKRDRIEKMIGLLGLVMRMIVESAAQIQQAVVGGPACRIDRKVDSSGIGLLLA